MEHNLDTDASKGVLVWGALALVLRVSSWFGIAPLKFERRGGRLYVTISKWMSIYGYTLVFSLGVAVILGVMIDTLGRKESVHLNSPIAYTLWNLNMIIIAVINIYGTVTAGARMQFTLNCLLGIIKIMSKLNKGRPWQHNEKRRCFLLVVVLFLGITYKFGNIFLELFVVKMPCLPTLLFICHVIQDFIVFLLELQFVFTALLAHAALKMVNGTLLGLLLVTDLGTSTKYKPYFGSPIEAAWPTNVNVKTINILIDTPYIYVEQSPTHLSTTELKSTRPTIRLLALAYMAICDVTRETARNNAVILYLRVLSFLINLIQTPYYLILVLLAGNQNPVMVGLILIWFLYHLMELVIIVQPQHMTDQEIVKTNALLGRLLSRAQSAPLKAELRRFCQQVALNRVAYAPLGLWTLSRPLLVSILASVVTNLLVLVQFKPIDKLF